jgi:hypothetical protein
MTKMKINKNKNGKELETILEEIKENHLKTDDEKTKLFLALKEKYGMEFCGGDETYMTFKDPSTCGGCVRGQAIMKTIFGDYAKMPFVEYEGDRVYNVDLKLAETFLKDGKLGVEVEKEKRSLEKAKEELMKEQEQDNKEKEKLYKRYGNDIAKIPGLVEKLLESPKHRRNGSETLLDLKVDVEQGVAAYIVESHWWSDSSGIGKSSDIRVLRAGQEKEISKQWRDQSSASSDNYANDYNKIDIKSIAKDKVVVEATPARDEYASNKSEFTFDIANGTRTAAAAKEEKTMGIDDKIKLLAEAHSQMNAVKMSHQHNHPLYKPTEIKEFKIDYQSGKAAFILFEQIDTDRCTPEGEGWLGNQYRYSVWLVDAGKTPKQLYEDHGYIRKSVSHLTGSKGRDPMIGISSLDKDKIKLRNAEEKTIELKI